MPHADGTRAMLAARASRDAETFRRWYRRKKRAGEESDAARFRWKAIESKRLARRFA